MRSIFKYTINLTGSDNIINAPITKFLSAGEQYGNMVVWAEVDTSLPNRQFVLFPIGTGWSLDATKEFECPLDICDFIGTVMLCNGELVFHIYVAEIVNMKMKKFTPNNEKEATAQCMCKCHNNEQENREAIKIKTKKSWKGVTSNGEFVEATINPEVLALFTK